jgi:hypothetical protein
MEEVVFLIISIALLITGIVGTSVVVIYRRRDKKQRIELAKEERRIDRTMPEHMKVIYATWPKDKMVLGNCPHCTGIMLTMHDKKFVYYCPGCSVYWNIKLIDKPGVKGDANPSDV